MNKIFLMGNLTRDVEVNYSSGANPLAVGRFSLAVSRPTKDKETDFLNCVAFGKTAENISKFFHKGSKILVEGQIQTRTYEDKSGQKRYSTDIIVNNFEFCEKLSGSNNNDFPNDDKEFPFG